MDDLTTVFEAPSQLLSIRRSRRLLQNHSNLAQWPQLALSAFCTAALLIAITLEYTGSIAQPYRYLAGAAMLLILLMYNGMGIYRRFSDRATGMLRLLKAWVSVVGILFIASFLLKTTMEYSRVVIVFWVCLAYCVQSVIYLTSGSLSRWLRLKRKRSIPTLVVGAGALAQYLIEAIDKNSWLPDQIVGAIEDDALLRSRWSNSKVPIVGDTQQLAHIIKREQIRRVYIALPVRHSELIDDIQSQLLDSNVDVIWAPDIFHLHLLNHSVRELAGVPLISLSESPIATGVSAVAKSIFDKVIATIALILVAPLMILIAALIKITSAGPVLFKQKRDGWDGSVIEVWKFRSMYLHEEASGEVTQATVNDVRVTPLGRVLRRTSIDELPQLLNVLHGSMSLVGPRPHALAHNRSYSAKIDSYFSRHRIKPGITGLAQINGLRGETDTLEKMQQRVVLDIEYIRNWSIWLDLKILLLTPARLFSQKAY